MTRSAFFIFLFLSILLQNSWAEKVDFFLTTNKNVKKVVVAGDFNNWNKSQFVLDRLDETTWHKQINLKTGKYFYRFFLDDKSWIKDPANPFYGGKKSNSILYVYDKNSPKLLSVFPLNGERLKSDSLKPSIKVTSSGGWDLSRSNFIVNGKNYKINFSNDSTVLLVDEVSLADGDNLFSLDLKAEKDLPYPKISGLWTKEPGKNEPVANAGFFSIVGKDEKFSLNGGLSYDKNKLPLKKVTWVWDSTFMKIEGDTNSLFPEFIAIKGGIAKVYLKIGSDIDSTCVRVLSNETDNLTFSINNEDLADYSKTTKSLHLTGDFNHWQLLPQWSFKQNRNVWTLETKIKPGKYEYKLVINGSIWIEDPHNSNSIEDGWNGHNSILIINRDSSCNVSNGDIFIGNSNLITEKNISITGDRVTGPFFFLGTSKKANKVKIQKEDLGVFHLIKECGKEEISQSFMLKNALINSFETTPQWADSAIIYEIFIRRFASDGGGKFSDVLDKIPYIKSLGVNTVWFMPVYEGPTEHGYAPTEFFQTESDYGSLDEFVQLVSALKQVGIRVIFDFVANHMSDQHRYFRASKNTQSVYHDWFYWDAKGNYRYNADWDVLPDLRWEKPEVRHFMLDVALFWEKTGIDGFRCDAAWGVPHSFWKDLRIYLKEVNPDFLLIDEVLPRDPSFHENQFDASYDTDFYGNVLDLFYGKKSLDGLIFGLEKTIYNYPAETLDLRYIENHDMPRFAEEFDDESAILASVLLFLSPGMPLLYYGQEIGLKEPRGAMKWNDTDERSLKFIDHYRKMIILRKKLHILAKNKAVKYQNLGNGLLRIEGLNFSAWLNFSKKIKNKIKFDGLNLLYTNKTRVGLGEASISPLGFVIAD